jgi:hypothetical protein
MLKHRFGRVLMWIVLLGILLAGVVLVYNLPPVQERLGWRVSQLQAQIKYAISPPEEAVFTPDATLAAQLLQSRPHRRWNPHHFPHRSN